MAKAKARTQKLKVFRTPIGFHDAYVAAPSQKAALEAWGADSNLFAQGIAEQVDDPKLTEEPLERPGEVIKRLRGSEGEHFAALDKAGQKRSRAGSATRSAAGASQPERSGTQKPKPPKPPKPSRTKLDEAEEALENAQKRHKSELRELDREIEALERRRRELQRQHERERDDLAEERDRARALFERALRAWKS
jgi:hypothetical protein